jgi:hypothetical protein
METTATATARWRLDLAVVEYVVERAPMVPLLRR